MDYQSLTLRRLLNNRPQEPDGRKSISQDSACSDMAACYRSRIKLIRDNLTDQYSNASSTDALNGWLVHALDSIGSRLEDNNLQSSILPDDPEIAEKLFQLLDALGQQDFTGMNTEAFSIWLFGDSQYFKINLEKHVLPIILQLHPRLLVMTYEMSNDEVLAIAGLHQTSEIIEFCGPIALSIGGRDLDFSGLTAGSCIKSEIIPAILEIDASRINRLLLIEHKANYDQMLRDGLTAGELVIWHGSALSSRKELFLRKLATALPEDCRLEFWGDIDLGSFSHYLEFVRLVERPVATWRMDRTSLLAMRDQANRISGYYRRKLEAALKDPRYLPVADMLECMLETGLRLSQETFLPRRDANPMSPVHPRQSE